MRENVGGRHNPATAAALSGLDPPNAREEPRGEARAGPEASEGRARVVPGSGPPPAEAAGGGKARRGLGPLARLLIKLALIAGILLAAFTWVLGIHIQRGNRMHPFIMDGDILITYKLDTYRVGDAVAYKSPLTGRTEISRIAAIGAYEIQLTDLGQLLINGIAPEEKVFYPTQAPEDSDIAFPYYMTPEGVFLLDDFRTQGRDSRTFGQLTRSDLLGKVVYVFRRRGI